MFLDITATSENRGILYEIIAKTAEEVFMPFCVGGGVRDVADIRNLLLAGADKVCINTAAVENPRLISEAAELYGSQCIVVSIDYRRDGTRCGVYTHGGSRNTRQDVRRHAEHVADLGAGEILLTSIDRDGTMSGYDLDLIAEVADAVSVPVIASGGAGTLQHLSDAVSKAHASAVSVGSLFHFTDQSPIKARAFMRVSGLNVRK
jgi:cyclase